MFKRIKRAAVIFHFDAKFAGRSNYPHADLVFSPVIEAVLDYVGQKFLDGELDLVKGRRWEVELCGEGFELVLKSCNLRRPVEKNQFKRCRHLGAPPW